MSDWMEQAACRGLDPEAPFADAGTKGEALFVRVCNRCPVKEECLQFGLFEEWGIYGGLNRSQRKQVQGDLRRRERLGPMCGTNAGYYRHRRAGVEACDACRIAHNQHAYLWATERKSA